jgi:hypothetical protein
MVIDSDALNARKLKGFVELSLDPDSALVKSSGLLGRAMADCGGPTGAAQFLLSG